MKGKAIMKIKERIYFTASFTLTLKVHPCRTNAFIDYL